ncbi:MAG: ribonuclease [Actinomycetota bacterium]|nr:ribonuclease [Actinomycetota bacterium]
MSELERSDHGAITESPTLLPDHGGPQRPPAGREETAAEDSTEPNGSEPTTSGSPRSESGGASDRPPLLDENGLPKKRRRRGSRGGRGRKKPGTATGAAAGAGRANGAPSGSDVSGSERITGGGEDWTDATADRGLTSEDAGDQAREDAGLAERGASDEAPRPPRAQAATPRVGDSRPGTPATTPAGGAEEAPKKRRRRRGGRGRSKSGGAERVDSPRPPTARPAGGGRKPAAPSYVDAGLPLTDVDVDGTALLDTLDDETLLRRRGTHRKGRPAGRYLMVVHQRDDGIAHIAVLEGRTLVEHYVSMPTDDTLSIDGNIYLGRVQNVLPGMEAAFIDIGTPKNGVLYRGDVTYDPADVEGNQRPRIESVLRNGQSIIVQVTKNPIAHKGARLTQEVSLAGRFVVMVPAQPQTYGISKRLPEDERKRLRQVLDRLRPKDAGLIVRTAAEGATEDELERDMLRLNEQWRQISEFAKKAKPGSLLYKEPPLATRLIREEFTKEFRGVVIDDPALYAEVRGYVDAIAPELADRVEFYDAPEENLPIFEKFHVHEQLHKALERKVWLPSGGSLVIERTEALTVIDVNTGKNVGTSNLEETVYRNNLEAAEAIARELRLRDIGGIIVTDFIDMESRANREAVEEAFRQALSRDKTRTQVFPISELGLLEMTRKRVSEGLVEVFSTTCPQCNGRGFIVDESLLE